ncbi:putative Plant basic secretory protein family protein [Melia azedarach]|nr:putative Plant basic secretory protein family protein [Melia azedarach]
MMPEILRQGNALTSSTFQTTKPQEYFSTPARSLKIFFILTTAATSRARRIYSVSLSGSQARNTTQITTVEASRTGEFVISIRSSIMGAENVNYAIISAIQRGIARIWLWDGEARASSSADGRLGGVT